jgi:two-component system response regulator AtoC
LRRTLREYRWPGNVRELCCYVERLYAADIPPMPPTGDMWDDEYATFASPGIDPAPGRMPSEDHSPVCLSLAEAEAQAIRSALQHTGHNRTAAAKLLQIHRSTLLRKMRTYGLDR